jgi:hypothetical protein
MDHGLAPLPGKLKVKAIFRGEPPENTQGIYLMVAPQFPPHAINELYQSPNSLPVGQDTIYAEIDLPYGHYDAYALWWYSKDSKSNLADILELPLDPFNQLLPLGFDLSPEKPVVEKVLYPSWKRVRRTATIKGTIYFNGDFPPNTLATAVAAFELKPVESIHFLVMLKSIDFSIDKNPYTYTLPVHHGLTEYIAVFWLGENSSLLDFETIGVFSDPQDPGTPETLNIKEGETVEGIDIYADWSLLQGKK